MYFLTERTHIFGIGCCLLWFSKIFIKKYVLNFSTPFQAAFLLFTSKILRFSLKLYARFTHKFEH